MLAKSVFQIPHFQQSLCVRKAFSLLQLKKLEIERRARALLIARLRRVCKFYTKLENMLKKATTHGFNAQDQHGNESNSLRCAAAECFVLYRRRYAGCTKQAAPARFVRSLKIKTSKF
jgi:hypothetical protein